MSLELKVTIRNNQNAVLLVHKFTVANPGDLERGVYDATHLFRLQNPGMVVGWSFAVEHA
ncbi:hypothetical protein C8J33_101885 [Rhizobium sp. PP-CC-3G-465]|nr:hypothetical protein C8J33_101885 [Rhizobium sp. PP-CC-3G-465]